MNEVYINGVRYVPATEAAPSIDAIARGLLRRFWGDCLTDELHRLMKADYMRVYVNDNGEGPTMQNVLGDIAEEIAVAQQTGETGAASSEDVGNG